MNTINQWWSVKFFPVPPFNNNLTSTISWWQVSIRWFLLTLIFGLAYTQSPLYSSSQNTYFLHGLAQSGVGWLSQDWLAQTADPVPVFSLLVRLIVSSVGEWFFYICHLIILGIYLYSILGIATLIYHINESKLKLGMYVIAVVALHSALFNPPVEFGYNYLIWFLQAGVAQQHLLGRVFQPSTFGVLILWSIYLFLGGRWWLAVACSSLAATLHPTYVLSVAVLTLAYLLAIFKTTREFNQFKVGLWVSLITGVLIFPIVGYVWLTFSPTSPEIFNRAQEILVNYRLIYQANPSQWFGQMAAIQLIIVLVSLYLIRKTPLFIILLTLFVASVVLTLAQILTANKTLALLFPWRLSVFLVPLSSCLIVAHLINWLFQLFPEWLAKYSLLIQRGIVIVAMILPLYGILSMSMEFSNVAHANYIPMLKFVAATKQSHFLYLIPTKRSQKGGEMQNFRLATGVPVLVDTKSHPYQDEAVVEWFERIKAASQFYEARGQIACQRLQILLSKYPITHLVMESDKFNSECGLLRNKIYSDAYFSVYKL